MASGQVHLAAGCALGSAEAPGCGCSLALGFGELLEGFGSLRAGSSEQVLRDLSGCILANQRWG